MAFSKNNFSGPLPWILLIGVIVIVVIILVAR